MVPGCGVHRLLRWRLMQAVQLCKGPVFVLETADVRQQSYYR